MRQVITAFIAMTCFTLWDPHAAQAQLPSTVSVGFRNRSDTAVIVQGYTIVNNVQRRGQTLKIQQQIGLAFESNVPIGVRYYTIYDANQPARVLLRDFPVLIQTRDLFFSIEPSPLNPRQVILRPAPAP